ncbi:chromatin remodeling complex / DNA-dep ATPase [Anopheles sinensis]|uniref:Chromatin remodeling complex / DNA-dep ATPase n=1 Tax=Anopheles sinensis TaxID=74873 RepID=A0A084VSI2_ANOSI|nr:chromatin remodeling complex / DNA-dep ATPase [Anopheles sinensis]
MIQNMGNRNGTTNSIELDSLPLAPSPLHLASACRRVENGKPGAAYGNVLRGNGGVTKRRKKGTSSADARFQLRATLCLVCMECPTNRRGDNLSGPVAGLVCRLPSPHLHRHSTNTNTTTIDDQADNDDDVDVRLLLVASARTRPCVGANKRMKQTKPTIKAPIATGIHGLRGYSRASGAGGASVEGNAPVAGADFHEPATLV